MHKLFENEIIRASVDTLCRDGASIHKDVHTPESSIYKCEILSLFRPLPLPHTATIALISTPQE